MLDLKQILDKINKDLKEISKFDHVATRREKAEFIICNWKKWTKNAKENIKMQDLIAERNVLVVQQQNKIIKTSVVRDQVVRTALSKPLELKTTWDNQDITNYYIIDLGNKDTMWQVHDLLDEDELKLLFRRLLLDDEEVHIDEKTRKYLELFDQIIDEENKENIHYDTVVNEVAEINLLDKTDEETKYTGDDENFNKSIAKMKEIMDQLDDFHLGTIIKMNGAMKNVPERTWIAHVLAYLFFVTFCFMNSLRYYSYERSISTKIDVQENNFKADGVLELFERPMQIPLFLLEVSEGPNNPDPDKINEDRSKLMKEGVFTINKFMTRTKLPTLEVCSTLKFFFWHNDLVTILKLEIKMFEKFSREGQKLIMKPKNKYPTGVTPERPNAVTFAQFLPKISKGDKNKVKGRGRGRSRGRVDKEFAS
ncbi:hypothetical protein F8M41_002995 [Gigaspora margarita]|uniref:Uncharacterized protein n=1 Tax=Gigaspora margarita TaxID=4874 RepID=A0A8H3XBX0_GIGMA|nr:hypothetical protein F8M41_002995 [Gigaspora margarita]